MIESFSSKTLEKTKDRLFLFPVSWILAGSQRQEGLDRERDHGAPTLMSIVGGISATKVMVGVLKCVNSEHPIATFCIFLHGFCNLEGLFVRRIETPRPFGCTNQGLPAHEDGFIHCTRPHWAFPRLSNPCIHIASSLPQGSLAFETHETNMVCRYMSGPSRPRALTSRVWSVRSWI